MWCELGGTKKDGVRFAKITARWVIFLLKVWEQHQWSSIRGRFGGSDIFCVCPLRSSLQWRASSGEALDVRTQVFTPILSTVHLLQKLLLRSGSLENISLTGSGGSTECLQSTCCLPSGCQNSFFQDIVRVVKWPTIILPTILSIPTPKHHRELLKNEFKCRENEIVLETKVTDPMYSCQRSQVEKLVELPFFSSGKSFRSYRPFQNPLAPLVTAMPKGSQAVCAFSPGAPLTLEFWMYWNKAGALALGPFTHHVPFC